MYCHEAEDSSKQIIKESIKSLILKSFLQNNSAINNYSHKSKCNYRKWEGRLISHVLFIKNKYNEMKIFDAIKWYKRKFWKAYVINSTSSNYFLCNMKK